MENKISIEKIEAEALMAGIAVDTKNFTFKTGVRTFEAASLLKRFGADTTQVKQFFQDDLTTFISKANLVSSAKLYEHEVAISVCPDIVPNATLIAAQAADDLLNIRGISTSFVISMNEEQIVFISGRSLGDTNVQMILEKLGGGGHMTTAGAQFKETSMDAVHDMLIRAINDYFEESETK
jgi:c-di-AMP phosphodiesterase-like protein